MAKIWVKGVIAGTLIFLTLLGVGLLGFRPAFELALLFSTPSIYLVGPVFSLLAFESLDGPPGGVALILVSAWLELTVIVSFVTTLLFRRRLSNPSFERDAAKARRPSTLR